MIILGIQLKRPAFWSLTQAVVIAIALWLPVLALTPIGSFGPITAGAFLVAMLAGSVSNAIGIEVKKGGRHWALNIAGCLLAMLLYLGIATAFV
jgi:hypothetical protein